ncbi:hypothetical protein FRC12_013911 [Ceratobasidium sp. 428]|nr:hypothetical protein FRC12_013911 [Ceratobasidium sp. 428]
MRNNVCQRRIGPDRAGRLLGKKNIHPTVEAGNGPFNSMRAGSSSVAPPPPLTGGAPGVIGPAPSQSRPQPNSHGPDGTQGPVGNLPALALHIPIVLLDPLRSVLHCRFRSASVPDADQVTSSLMDMDCAPPAPSSLLLVHPQSQGLIANQTQPPPPSSLSAAAGLSSANAGCCTRSPVPCHLSLQSTSVTRRLLRQLYSLF